MAPCKFHSSSQPFSAPDTMNGPSSVFSFKVCYSVPNLKKTYAMASYNKRYYSYLQIWLHVYPLDHHSYKGTATFHVILH